MASNNRYNSVVHTFPLNAGETHLVIIRVLLFDVPVGCPEQKRHGFVWGSGVLVPAVQIVTSPMDLNVGVGERGNQARLFQILMFFFNFRGEAVKLEFSRRGQLHIG